LNAKPQVSSGPRKPRTTQKRSFPGGYNQGMGYGYQGGYQAGMGVQQTGHWTNPPQYGGDGKRRKLEQQPRLSYVQQLAQNGIIVTKESAIEKIESMRQTDPKEAFKYFLEVNEVFKGTEEYDTYYNTLLQTAREVRSYELKEHVQEDETNNNPENTTEQQHSEPQIQANGEKQPDATNQEAAQE